MKKRILCCVLALLMVAGVLPLTAFAEQEDVFHYVVIGDSTTNGYGFAEYDEGLRGFMQTVPDTYPVLIKKYLESEGKTVELHQFAGSALRPDDLDAILDPDHVDDDYTRRVFSENGSGHEEWFETWGHEIDPSVTDCATGEPVLRAAFYDAIGKADLITYYLGSNSFGTFITSALTNDRYGDDDTLQDLLAAFGITEQQVNVAEVRALIMSKLAEALDGQVDLAALDAQFGEYVDLLVQGYVGAVIYFTKNMEIIRTLNPDCDIVVAGLHNYLDFLKVTVEGQELDLGSVYGALLGAFNVYTGGLCSRADNYYYADLMDVTVPTFLSELVANEPDETLQGYLDDFIGGIVKGFAPEQLGAASNAQVGAMLRGWKANGFADSDYALLAGMVTSMGLVDSSITGMLDMLSMDLATVLKVAYTYYKTGEIPPEAGLLSMLAPIVAPTLLDVGKKLDGIGGVQDVLLDCVTTDPLDLGSVMGLLAGGLDIDAIMGSVGEEVAAVVTGEQAALSDSTKTLIDLYFMFLFPNNQGIIIHPNKAGHQALADAFLDAWQNKIVARNYTVVKLLSLAETALDTVIDALGDVAVPTYSNFGLGDDDVKSYTSFGDSTVFGFGFGDFAIDSKLFNDTYGYGASDANAYPALIAAHYGVAKENFRQLAMGSLRAEDIYAILKGDKTGDVYYTDTILPLLDRHAGGIEKAHEDYVSAVENSDLISIFFGGNNFGQFVGSQMERVSAGEEPIPMDWSKFSDEKAAQVRALLDQAVPMVAQYLPDADTKLAQVVVESYIYQYFNVQYYAEKVLDEIHTLNPNAKIAVMGLYNPADEVYLQVDGTDAILRGGKIVDLIVSLINSKFCEYAQKNSKYCCFVDITKTEMFIDKNEKADLNFAHGTYISLIQNNHGLMNHPNEAGHNYMYRQLLDALGMKAVMVGDVNLDGEVNAKDRTVLARNLAEWHVYQGVDYDDIDLAAADVNADGVVDAKDRTVLARYLAEWHTYGGVDYDAYFAA